MLHLRTCNSALLSARFINTGRSFVSAAGNCCRRLLAAMHESRAREAAQVVARYAHLTAEETPKRAGTLLVVPRSNSRPREQKTCLKGESKSLHGPRSACVASN